MVPVYISTLMRWSLLHGDDGQRSQVDVINSGLGAVLASPYDITIPTKYQLYIALVMARYWQYIFINILSVNPLQVVDLQLCFVVHHYDPLA
jgi:hypothetical protein